MNDLHPTTRCYPRQLGHPKPEQVAIFGPYTAAPKHDNQAEFWVYIALAFAAGFVVNVLWGGV